MINFKQINTDDLVKQRLILMALLVSFLQLFSQVDSTQLKRRKRVLMGVETLGYTSSMTGLYFLWYNDYSSGKFHFFNDNNEWNGVDKVGHTLTAYQLGRYNYNWFKWAGISNKKSLWIGGSVGFLYLATVEFFDGFSTGWGFSYGDMVANSAGTLLFVGQQCFFSKQIAQLKFSFHQTRLANQNPDLLGRNIMQQMLKDYNGQTYWLSINIYDVLQLDNKFPNYVNLAVGYGAENMLNAKGNAADYKQFYLSLDIDLWKIKPKNKLLGNILHGFGFIKIPFPAVEFSKGKFYGHLVYF